MIRACTHQPANDEELFGMLLLVNGACDGVLLYRRDLLIID